jgi:hypothetical protein
MALTKEQENKIAELCNIEINNITYSIAKEINHVKIVKEIAYKMVSTYLQSVLSFEGEMKEDDLKEVNNIIANGVLEIGGKVDYFTPTDLFILETTLSLNQAIKKAIEISNEDQN